MSVFLDFSNNYQLTHFNIFGADASFHHFGIILKDNQNYPYSKIKYIKDPIQKVKVGFYKINDFVIEIVIPDDKNSPIKSALKNKVFYHHICFSVPNINKAIQNASEYGVRRISKIEPAVAFSNRSICWCLGNNFGLMELLEK